MKIQIWPKAIFAEERNNAFNVQEVSRVLETALNYFRTSSPELNEERAMLLEEWLEMEAGFGELGYVSIVQSKLPKKLKRRKQIMTEDGSAGHTEYIEYLFPEETQTNESQDFGSCLQMEEAKSFYRRWLGNSNFCIVLL
ncbi:hypothetical protein PanWU01x14_268200 [Parasponia andersonii]|uniref:Uncharacterized protein n=1 Tax=Parasponia andersonii TaxID=3476 RepID=A0A2P5B697_PARAD|nr:hypothetical protein PanWU01x14_268200 [Parasponia andersonii]